MNKNATQRSLAWLLSAVGIVALVHVGCDGDGGGGDGGGKPIAGGACSSCQESYTAEQCKKWGELAGCEVSDVEAEGSCSASFAGCKFTNCDGTPICADDGAASCASCDGDLSQADCDDLAAAAGCDSATTKDFTACGNPATGCGFLGCDFTPRCD